MEFSDAKRPALVIDRIPVEALFFTGALSQYVGATIAVKLFGRVPPLGVAWLRIVGASLALLMFNRGIGGSWKRADLKLAAILGLAPRS